MGAGWVCSCLLIVLASRGVNSLNPDAGPWVQPTHGEPWPMPNHRHVTDKFYLLRASTFQFNVSNWRERSRGKDSIYIRASLRIIDVSVFLPRVRESFPPRTHLVLDLTRTNLCEFPNKFYHRFFLETHHVFPETNEGITRDNIFDNYSRNNYLRRDNLERKYLFFWLEK